MVRVRREDRGKTKGGRKVANERAPSEARHNRSSIAITGLWLIRRSPREGRFPGAARERGLVSGDIRGLRRGNGGRELCAELDRARRGPASTFIRLR
ncbi:hypothetical protein ALC57_17883 [Trachymyrmex cornetzi]|uniref:Uncharacterized protein n=1 Tax=Trachymyrmex cornetzi TaxID=471704 RepID=A0A151ISW6_9HYME|nr:hypothetical protein ALC57_17883 [Trachymyrmex cornetzi]